MRHHKIVRKKLSGDYANLTPNSACHIYIDVSLETIQIAPNLPGRHVVFRTWKNNLAITAIPAICARIWRYMASEDGATRAT